MHTNTLDGAIHEVERLLKLTTSERESEGTNASDSQLKLVLKRLRTKNKISGITKFVADFSRMDSKLLRFVDVLESGNND